jgi:hypothetical protein
MTQPIPITKRLTGISPWARLSSSPGCNRQQGGGAAGEPGTGGPAKPPFHLTALFTEHSIYEQSPIEGELKP